MEVKQTETKHVLKFTKAEVKAMEKAAKCLRFARGTVPSNHPAWECVEDALTSLEMFLKYGQEIDLNKSA